MNQIDPEKAERVWSRVMGIPAQPAAAMHTQSDTPALNEQTLLQLLEAELRDCALYTRLARRTRGSVRRTLLCIAAAERQHAQTLGVLYYILTGRKACPAASRASCPACVTQALREQYAAELRSVQTYRALAEHGSEHASAFQRLSDEEAQHARCICQLLGRCLF